MTRPMLSGVSAWVSTTCSSASAAKGMEPVLSEETATMEIILRKPLAMPLSYPCHRQATAGKRVKAEARVHRIGQPPGQHRTARPVIVTNLDGNDVWA